MPRGSPTPGASANAALLPPLLRSLLTARGRFALGRPAPLAADKASDMLGLTETEHDDIEAIRSRRSIRSEHLPTAFEAASLPRRNLLLMHLSSALPHFAVPRLAAQLRARKAELFADGTAMGEEPSALPESASSSQEKEPRKHALHRLVYGCQIRLLDTPETRDAYVAALTLVAGADGQVTPAEHEWLADHALVLGLPEATFKAGNASAGSGGLLSFFAPEPPLEMRKAVLFDAVRMASQDGFSQEETDAAHLLCQSSQLGLSEEVCDEVISIVGEETRLQKKKEELFTAP